MEDLEAELSEEVLDGEDMVTAGKGDGYRALANVDLQLLVRRRQAHQKMQLICPFHTLVFLMRSSS
jgi:hypothetical protein